jgi:hypothetical protein
MGNKIDKRIKVVKMQTPIITEHAQKDDRKLGLNTNT